MSGSSSQFAWIVCSILALGWSLGCRDGDLFDWDGDGVVDNDDCEPQNDQIYPGAGENCTDGIDNDCDDDIDVEDEDCQTDNDGDGWAAETGDCDDTDPDIHPEAPEGCDGLDTDCDGEVPADEADQDSDGWKICDGDCDDGAAALNLDDVDQDGYSSCDGDCDDTDGSVVPGAEEICDDGIDNDCDGSANHCGWWGIVDLGDADARLIGEEQWDKAGIAVATAGDVNDDGNADILLGADEGSWPLYSGVAYLLYGPVLGTVDLSAADVRWTGEVEDDFAGNRVATAGDVDGDGYDDILIAAPEHDFDAKPDRGAAYLFYGSQGGIASGSLADADAKIMGEMAQDYAGSAVSTAGDMNGDGFDDILIGAPDVHQDGVVYLLYGPVTGDVQLGEPNIELIGQTFDGGAGSALAAAGDVNQDDEPDILVAEWYGGIGSVFLLHGPITEDRFLDSAAATLTEGGDPTGISVSGNGDVDGDGIPDILVGALSYPGQTGGAYLQHGPVLGTINLGTAADIKLEEEANGDRAGMSVSFAGDVDADGYDDVLVGAPVQSAGGNQAGAAYLFYGPISGDQNLAQADVKFVGQAADRAGEAVSSAGDVNQDGYDDILVGAPGNSDGGDQAGAVYLFLGNVGL